MVDQISESKQEKEDPFGSGVEMQERMVDQEFPVRVMEPRRVEALPPGEYLYQVKWDGMRWITYKSEQGILFQTKAQKIFKSRFGVGSLL